MPERPPISVHLLPAVIPTGALAGGVAVVIDVLRATTAMTYALAAGIEAIIPCLEIDEARAIAARGPGGPRLLAGERTGIPIEGFDFGNSPDDYTPERCRGRTLVMTTTNGTRALLASLEADRIFTAAFVNLGATARAVEADGRPVHLVCSGTDGLVSLEDTLFAGALVAALDADRLRSRDDAALLAAQLWEVLAPKIAGDAGEGGPSRPLRTALSEGRGGHRVRELGLGADLDAVSRIDRFDLVVELKRDPIRLVAGSP